MGDDLGPWEPMSPKEVARLFGWLPTPWWIAGGYAIELFLGHAVRRHDDIDVLLLRRDQQKVHEVLEGWDIRAADPPGTLRTWEAGEWLPPDVHDIWCREHPCGPWRIQVMLDEADGGEWRSRRDPRIRRPISSLGLVTDDGTPILAPEVQLFYKAKNLRPKDEEDFAAALPRLGTKARHWLYEALTRTAPGHPWTAALAVTR